MTGSTCRYVVTETGERIGFDMCFAPECGLHISRCTCEAGPTPPRLGVPAASPAGASPAVAAA